MGIIDKALDWAAAAKDIDQRKMIVALTAEIQSLRDEKRELQDRVREIERRLDLGDRLAFHDDAYWLTQDGEADDGPFCSVCWDTNRQLVRLHSVNEDGRGFCKACKSGTYRPTPAVSHGRGTPWIDRNRW